MMCMMVLTQKQRAVQFSQWFFGVGCQCNMKHWQVVESAKALRGLKHMLCLDCVNQRGTH